MDNLLLNNMPQRHQQVAHYLLEIELELRRLNYWQDCHPSAGAFASELPFCHDTLEFPQWLQFVFLQRMKMLLEASGELPQSCGIAPYAEEYFKAVGRETQVLLKHLAAIDQLLTDN